MISTSLQADGLTYLIVQIGLLFLVLAVWWQVMKPYPGAHR